MNMLSKNLLQDVLERMDTHQDGVCSKMELETESAVQVLHTQDKLAEIFSNRHFCNKIASLRTELLSPQQLNVHTSLHVCSKMHCKPKPRNAKIRIHFLETHGLMKSVKRKRSASRRLLKE